MGSPECENARGSLFTSGYMEEVNRLYGLPPSPYLYDILMGQFCDSCGKCALYEKWPLNYVDLLAGSGPVESGQCHPDCPEGWETDGVCDTSCNIEECGYDDGKCDGDDE